MPDIHMDLTPWPVGTTVELYARVSELKLDDMPPPGLDPVATTMVAADSSVTFAAVPEGSYWAIAPINARYRYVAVFAQEGFVAV